MVYPSGFACPALLGSWVDLVSPLVHPSVYFVLGRFVSGCGSVFAFSHGVFFGYAFPPLFQCPRMCLLLLIRVGASGCFYAPVPVGALVPLDLLLLAVPCALFSASYVVSLGSCLQAWSDLRSGIGGSRWSGCLSRCEVFRRAVAVFLLFSWEWAIGSVLASYVGDVCFVSAWLLLSVPLFGSICLVGGIGAGPFWACWPLAVVGSVFCPLPPLVV